MSFEWKAGREGSTGDERRSYDSSPRCTNTQNNATANKASLVAAERADEGSSKLRVDFEYAH